MLLTHLLLAVVLIIVPCNGFWNDSPRTIKSLSGPSTAAKNYADVDEKACSEKLAAMEKKNAELTEEVSKYKDENMQLKEKLKENEETHMRFKRQNTGGLPACQADLADCQGNLTAIRNQLSACNTSLANATSFANNCSANLTACTNSLDNCTSFANNCSASLANCTNQLTACNTSLTNCTSFANNCSASLANCTNQLTACNTSLANCTTFANNCSASLNNCTTQLANCSTNLNSCLNGTCCRNLTECQRQLALCRGVCANTLNLFAFTKLLSGTYLFSKHRLSWNDARDYCHLYNMELASVTTNTEDAALKAELNRISRGGIGMLKTSYWLGLNKLNASITDNGSIGLMLNVLTAINRFRGNCLAYSSTLSSDFRILPLECNIPRFFICKLPAYCV